MNQGTFAVSGTLSSVGLGTVLAEFPFDRNSLPTGATAFSFTAPVEGVYDIFLVGAGGSGAAIYVSGGTGGIVALGGSGAGFGFKSAPLNAGDKLSITLGAGGASAIANVSGTYTNGNAGGNTSVTGPGVSMYIPGAPGGVCMPVGYFGPNYPLGGSACSGADYAVTGGMGGIYNCTPPDAAYTCYSNSLAATGGGSAGSLFGVGQDGGMVTKRKSYNSCTGGGSVTFSGARDNTTTTCTGAGAGTGQAILATAGYPKLFPTLSAVTAISGVSSVTYPVVPNGISALIGGMEDTLNPFLRMFGGSAAIGENTVSGPGAGGSAAYISSVNGLAGHAGTCGGSGAARTSTASLGTISSGYPGIGGGSGGCYSVGANSFASSALGGNAFCFISLRR